jgi:hypothetical protein
MGAARLWLARARCLVSGPTSPALLLAGRADRESPGPSTQRMAPIYVPCAFAGPSVLAAGAAAGPLHRRSPRPRAPLCARPGRRASHQARPAEPHPSPPRPGLVRPVSPPPPLARRRAARAACTPPKPLRSRRVDIAPPAAAPARIVPARVGPSRGPLLRPNRACNHPPHRVPLAAAPGRRAPATPTARVRLSSERGLRSRAGPAAAHQQSA